MNFLNSWSALVGKAKPLIRNRVLAGSGTWHFMCLMRHQVFFHLIGSILKEADIDALKIYVILLFDINALFWHYSFIIRLFQKWTYYALAMSVCPSIRPSVRVFQTFCQHALRYQFETWCMYSVGGTTCRVWVALWLGHFDVVYSQK